MLKFDGMNFLLYLSSNTWMKVSACILCVYLLVLIAIPCVDLPEDFEQANTELNQNNTDSSPNDVDLCSPFCACNCCVSPIANQDFFILPYHSMFSHDYNSAYKAAKAPSPCITIWEPPKIS
jgi:hypothetical protein